MGGIKEMEKLEKVEEIEEKDPARLQTDRFLRSESGNENPSSIAGHYPEVEGEVPLPKRPTLDANEDLDGLLPIK